jgi:hypothetical protein
VNGPKKEPAPYVVEEKIESHAAVYREGRETGTAWSDAMLAVFSVEPAKTPKRRKIRIRCGICGSYTCRIHPIVEVFDND